MSMCVRRYTDRRTNCYINYQHNRFTVLLRLEYYSNILLVLRDILAYNKFFRCAFVDVFL